MLEMLGNKIIKLHEQVRRNRKKVEKLEAQQQQQQLDFKDTLVRRPVTDESCDKYVRVEVEEQASGSASGGSQHTSRIFHMSGASVSHVLEHISAATEKPSPVEETIKPSPVGDGDRKLLTAMREKEFEEPERVVFVHVAGDKMAELPSALHEC
jgi:hypothetical protein